jgi:hypothetical protein
MNVDRAIAIIESVLAPKLLNYVQIEIVRGAIAGNTYQEIIDTTEVNSAASIQARSEQIAALPNSEFDNFINSTKSANSTSSAKIEEIEPSKYKISSGRHSVKDLVKKLPKTT